MKTIEERFWEKVDKKSDDECWEWTRCKVRGGYGWFNTGEKYFLAHRFAWKFTYGDIPLGMLVCHTCDNPPCCNPKHLWIGTDKDNAVDRVKKNRQSRGTTNHPKIRVSPEQVKEMRKLICWDAYQCGN